MGCKTIFTIPRESRCSAHLRWYALRVKSNREMVVAATLKNRGYEEFLPTYTRGDGRGPGGRHLVRPLFPGYVFARLDLARRLPVLTIPGVVHILGMGKTPIPVAEEEIAAIRTIVASSLPVQPWPSLKPGDRVLIESGPLAGIEGTLIGMKGQYRLVASVTLLQRSVAVEIDYSWVRSLNHSGAVRREYGRAVR